MVGAGGRLAGRVAAQQPGRSGSKPWLEAALCYNAPAQKTCTWHSDQQRRNKDSRRKPIC